MAVQHVLAVIPVRDLDTARDWYSRLLGREPDNNPMPSLVEWQPVPGAWIQVYVDPDRAGRTQLNLAVDDLDTEIAAATAGGVEVGDVVEANKSVRLAPITDPDGNVVTLIGGFRVDY